MFHQTYIFDPAEKVDKALPMAWQQFDWIDQLLPLSMRDHGQLVDIIAEALVDETL